MVYRPRVGVALVVLGCCATLHLLAQDAPLPVLTQEKAVELALKGNRQIQSGVLDVTKSDAAVREAKANRYPQTNVFVVTGYPLQQIQFDIPAGVLGTYPGTGPIPGKSSEIGSPQQITTTVYGTVAQPLSQLYKVHLGVLSAQNAERFADAALQGQQVESAHQVRTAYANVLQLQAKVEADASELEYLKQASITAQRNLEQGAALKGDVLQSEAAIKQEQYQIMVDEDDLIMGKESLNRMLGRDLNISFSVVMPSNAEEDIDLAAARTEALKLRAEIRQASLQVQKVELEVRNERAGYIPDISAQVTYLGFQGVSFLPSNVANVGLSLHWKDPWDWGQRRDRIREFRATSAQDRLSEQDAEQKVLLDVDQSYRKFKEAQLRIDAAAAAQEAAREGLREVTNQYGQHAALLSDVLKQRAAFSQQSGNYRQSVAALWSAGADFKAAIGEQ
jgi:outer membrane protein TolC